MQNMTDEKWSGFWSKKSEVIELIDPLEFFTISLQNKNANIANIVLALPTKINQFNVAFNLEM